LQYLETIAAKWLFSQEKATSHDICKSMRIVEPLLNPFSTAESSGIGFEINSKPS
jgi:hypothetical protein